MTMEQTVVDPTVSEAPRAPRRPGSGGILLALVSAATFSLSGSFGQSLLAIGWSPGAIVTWRLALAALVLLPFTWPMLRGGRWRRALRRWPMILAYGVLATAACQAFYFYSVQRLSVAVALLLEYTSPVMIVLGTWLITRRRPGAITLLGALVAMAGLATVLEVYAGFRADALGVLFGLCAAVGSAAYFVIGSRVDDDLPPLVLASLGLAVGAVVLALLGAVGVLKMTVVSAPVVLVGVSMHWIVPLLGVAILSGAVAYLTGNSASRRLGPRFASFLGLLEVVFAALWAWVLVGQKLGLPQLIGGAVILTGVAMVKADELRTDRRELRDQPSPEGPGVECREQSHGTDRATADDRLAAARSARTLRTARSLHAARTPRSVR